MLYMKILSSNIKYAFFVLFACFLLPTGLASTSHAGILEDLRADFIARFDSSIKVDRPANIKFKRTGGGIVPDGISGRALSLSKGQYLTLPTKDIINAAAGTISLWIRPHWLSDSPESHTFVTFGWVSPKPAYFALSRGWWESGGGSGFTYFIGNNAEATNTGRRIHYHPGKWVHLVCTWETGSNGFTRFYVNGSRVEWRDPAAEGKRPWLPYIADANLFIGSDKGAKGLENNRWADSDIDELAIFKRALSDEEIALTYYGSIGKTTYQPIRDANGAILQTRVIADEGRGWMTPDGAAETITRIKKAGFNVYIPCIWHGQGTRYPSELAAPEVGKTFHHDPLKRLIDSAHSNGIEVHPLFTIVLRQRSFYKAFYDAGTPADAFDVHKPAFKKFIADLVIDVVRRYDVDGINLDYIRTLGICTSRDCQSDYSRQFGRDLLSDIKHPKADGTLELHLQKWQDDAITAIVREIRDRAKAIRPQIIISTDGYPSLRPSEEGREDLRWADSGLIDIAFAMDYREVPDYERLEHIITMFKEPAKLIPILGNYEAIPPSRIEPRNPELVARAIEHTLSRTPHGIALYLYDLLTEDQIMAISRGPFREQAKPQWKRNVNNDDTGTR